MYSQPAAEKKSKPRKSLPCANSLHCQNIIALVAHSNLSADMEEGKYMHRKGKFRMQRGKYVIDERFYPRNLLY